MGTLLHDLRYAGRTLAKNPGFTLIAILVLALGIGSSTAVFSVVNGVLLQPLPYPHPQRLVQVMGQYANNRAPALTADAFLYLQQRSHVFSSLTAFDVLGGGFNLTGSSVPAHVSEIRVTPGFFRVFGVSPALGRGFTQSEGRPGSGNFVILSHQLWQQRFGGDRSILGRAISLSGAPYTVVGVMPAGFRPSPQADLWVPLKLAFNPGETINMFQIVGRLKPGVTLARANDELGALASQLRHDVPSQMRHQESLSGVGYQSAVTGGARTSLLLLLGAVGLLLLIACANVANLLLSRSSVRTREMAIRAALGAGRFRLLRHSLTESVLLGLAGGALGVAFCLAGFRGLLTLLPADLPRAANVGIDAHVLLFALAAALLTGIVFGLAPALQAFRINVDQTLRGAGSRTSTGGGHRIRNLLVVGEFALSLVLLTGAVLLMQTFTRLRDIKPGFDVQHTLNMQISLTGTQYAATAGVSRFFSQVSQRVRGLRGIQAAAFSSNLPLQFSANLPFRVVGQKPRASDNADYRLITPGYFQAMGIPLVSGRALNQRDGAAATPVVVINEALAREVFPHSNPIGQHLVIGAGMGATFADPPREIIGIAANMRDNSLRMRPMPTVFVPWAQVSNALNATIVGILPANLVIRTAGSPLPYAVSVPRAIQAIDPLQPAFNIRPLSELVSASLAAQRFSMLLFGLFAGVALLLATAGIYGVMSYTVTQRTREFGIRVLLGAGPGTVLGMVVRQALTLALIGAVVGIAASLGLNRLLTSMLYGVKPYAPAPLILATVLLASVAVAASYLPARRATQVNPAVALRDE